MTPDPALLDRVVVRLRAAGCVWAEDEAALLMAEASDPMDLEQLVDRRVAGEPLEPLLGWAELCGVRVALGSGVFVPRQRSALLVRLALRALADDGRVLVDLCCGSGALGLVVATLAGRPLEVHAADLDPVATGWAARNLAGVGGVVHTGDLYAALPSGLTGRVDVLVVNAPYVPSGRIRAMPSEARDHEPLHTLDGGADGLDLHRRVAADARSWLAPGGVLVLETSRPQAPSTLTAVEAGGLPARVVHDQEPGGTAVVGRRTVD